ncbi:MAG: guanylate kinase [Candidatus Hydrogenedentes bacterium]|nr:guanylate kinase [Candidatus Hydrogenedentota bacterium]
MGASSTGLLLILSAPSGAGKLTLLREVRQEHPGLCTTISATTRQPRPGEIDGRDYYFLAREDFEARRDRGEFAEWAEVHANLYGTLKCELQRCLAENRVVILELDVQGMRSMRQEFPEAVTVFIMPPSIEELDRRLRGRGDTDEADIALRLSNARLEMDAANEFDYVVINDEVKRAARDLGAILTAEHCRSHRVLQLT